MMLRSPDTEGSLDNICYTVAVGRGHHVARAAVVTESLDGLYKCLCKILELNFEFDSESGIDSSGWYGYGSCKKSNMHGNEPWAISPEYEYDLDEKAQYAVEKYRDFWDIYEPDLLQQLAELYIYGASVPWELLYKDVKYRRLSLPIYPFKKNRCWLSLPKSNIGKSRSVNWKEQRYFCINWRQNPINLNRSHREGPIIILTDGAEFGSMAKNLFSQDGSDTIVVRYARNPKTSDEIDGSEVSFSRLFSRYDASENLKIIHLWTLQQENIDIESTSQLEESQYRGAYSLFNIARAVSRADICGSIQLDIVSRLVSPVRNGDILNPQNATMYGMGKGVRREFSNIRCKFIDIDYSTSPNEIVEELLSETEEYACAYRNGQRYVEEFSHMVLDEADKLSISIRENGVYIITGGYGGLGLEMAHLLAKSGVRRIALVGRTELPARSAWEGIVSSGNVSRMTGKLTKLLDIERLGTNLVFCKADISDEESLSALIHKMKVDYEKINGVIHCAGVAITKEISDCEFSELQNAFAPKVYGTWLLDKYTKNEDMDFFIMFSSIATVFEAIGQAGYIAANSYLDSFGYAKKSGKGVYQTINWATWKETGMAFDNNFTFDTIFKAITTEQALRGFVAATSSGAGRVIIGEINFEGKLINKMKQFGLGLANNILLELDSISNVTSRPAKAGHAVGLEKLIISGREDRNYSENEKLISKICQEVLGYEEINIHENFFEMGADSILVKQISMEIQKYFTEISVTDIFEYSTISKLAGYLDKIALTRMEADNRQGIAEAAKSEEKLDRYLSDMLDALAKDELSINEALDDIDKLLMVNV